MNGKDNDNIYVELANKWLNGTISAEEKQRFADWYNALEDAEVQIPAFFATDEETHRLRILQKIRTVIEQENDLQSVAHRVHFLKTSWFRYAAAVILLLGGVAVWYRSSTRTTGKGSVAAVQTKDIQPGTNRAILTVGNNTINLSNNKTGIAVNNAVTYNDGETISGASSIPLVKGDRAGRRSGAELGGDLAQMLQLTTPRGGQYQAVLPDGTKVWLNAASSIKFPSKFAGDKREVEITGEAYLEVAKNTKQPFYVHTTKETIQVLGTSFNVNAYADEETEKTTLIDGSVRVAGVILKPGQQAELTHKSQITTHQANLEQTLAWKNGLFNFEGASLEEVMQQLSRWYDIEVVYEGNKSASSIRFFGKLNRSITLASLIKILKASEVNFRIEDGRKLIVTP